MSYNIKTDYAFDSVIDEDDLNLRGDILQAQLPGAFEALGIGVMHANDLLAGTSNVAPGNAIIRNEAGVPVYVRVPNALPIPARGEGEFLQVVLRVAEQDDLQGTSSARGAPPILRVSEDEEEPDSLLLAQWDGAQWVDRRPKSALALLSQLQDDIGYDATIRELGSLAVRLAALEAPLDETGDDFNVRAALNAQKARIDALALELAELKDKTNEGAVITIRETPSNLIINSGKMIAELAHLNPTNSRQFIAGVDMPGKTGDAQDWNGVAAPVVRIGGNADYDDAEEVIRP